MSMSEPTTLMSDTSPDSSPDSSAAQPSASQPLILASLAEIPKIKTCSPNVAQQLDLMLLALEALEVGGGENMLAAAKKLELQDIVKNRVVMWRLRCTNPWRRSYTRNILTLEQAKALVILVGDRASILTALIRQLLLAEQQMGAKALPLEHHFRLSQYLESFRSHYKSRMNPRRAKVEQYLASEDKLNQLAISLLNKLLFCTGTRGRSRLWFSLFDGEVA